MDYWDYKSNKMKEIEGYEHWLNVLLSRIKRNEDYTEALKNMFIMIDRAVIKEYDAKAIISLEKHVKLFIAILLACIFSFLYALKTGNAYATAIPMTMLVSTICFYIYKISKHIKQRRIYFYSQKERMTTYLQEMLCIIQQQNAPE